MMHDKLPGRLSGNIATRVSFDKSKSKINPGGHPSRRPKWTVGHENPVRLYPYFRVPFLEFARKRPMGRRSTAIQNTRLG